MSHDKAIESGNEIQPEYRAGEPVCSGKKCPQFVAPEHEPMSGTCLALMTAMDWVHKDPGETCIPALRREISRLKGELRKRTDERNHFDELAGGRLTDFMLTLHKIQDLACEEKCSRNCCSHKIYVALKQLETERFGEYKKLKVVEDAE